MLQIVQFAARNTTDVIVLTDIAIETSLTIRPCKLCNRTHPGEDIQITVDGSQTDLGQPATHLLE
jgi:hypothetical protein